MFRIRSRTVMLGLLVCLGGTIARAEEPELPPIEAPADGSPPVSGAFSQPTPPPAAEPPPATTKPAATTTTDSGQPELLIPMTGITPEPETAPAPPAEPAPVAIPTRPAPPSTPAPAPAPAEAEVAPPPSDIPADILLPPTSEKPAVATTPAEGSTPAPVAAKAPAAPETNGSLSAVLPEPLAFDNNWKVRFLPYAAVGFASDLGFPTPTETSLQGQGIFTAGATLAVTSGPIAIEGHFSDSFYQQRYLTKQLSSSGGLATLDVDEQKMNADLWIGYELMHHMDPKLAKNLLLTPFVGGGARLLISDNLPMNMVGPEVGGRLSIAASSSLVFAVTYAFVPNLMSYQGPSLLFGAPKFDHTVDVDISLRLFGAARARLSYLSEYVTLASAYRAYQSVGLGFDYGF